MIFRRRTTGLRHLFGRPRRGPLRPVRTTAFALFAQQPFIATDATTRSARFRSSPTWLLHIGDTTTDLAFPPADVDVALTPR